MEYPVPRYEINEEKNPLPAKRYKFRFSALIVAVFIIGLVLCATGFSLTTWQFVDFVRGGDLGSALEWIKYALLYIVSIAIAVIIAAMLIRSEYILTEKKLTLSLGVIRTSSPLDKIYSVHLFKGANKLAVYFDGEKTRYMVIVIKDSLYDDFVRELLLRNERIGFSFSTAEEENEFKKKK